MMQRIRFKGDSSVTKKDTKGKQEPASTNTLELWAVPVQPNDLIKCSTVLVQTTNLDQFGGETCMET